MSIWVGIVQYFFCHTIKLHTSSQAKSKRITHLFAWIHWFRQHWRESWFQPRVLVLQPDMDVTGPATLIPVSRVFCRCGLMSDTVQFEYAEDLWIWLLCVVIIVYRCVTFLCKVSLSYNMGSRSTMESLIYFYTGQSFIWKVSPGGKGKR